MRRALWTALLLAALWLAGYLAFFAGVLAQSRAPLTQGAGAIVVLTGAPGRVDMGISLLRVRLAPRLFISGVNPASGKAAILGAGNVDLADRVTLGQGAQTTAQNAAEVSAWLRSRPLRSLRLVTSAYHMPRALMEMRAALPDGVEIVPHPVPDPRFDRLGWPLLRLVADEYHKTLLRWAQITLATP